MKVWQVIVISFVLVLLAVAPVMAKPGGGEYLGKYAVGDEVAFSWTVDAATSPLWSVYRDDRATAGYWKGLLRCTGCFEETSPGVWSSSVYLSSTFFAVDNAYMICAEYGEWGAETNETWTFRIGGKGNKPVRSDVAAGRCP